jgi:hypothetical protein
VCDPIIAKVYQAAGGQGGSKYDDEDFEDLWARFLVGRMFRN